MTTVTKLLSASNIQDEKNSVLDSALLYKVKLEGI